MTSKVKSTTNTAPASNGSLRKGWRRVRFGEVVRDVNEAERNPLNAGLERFVGLEHIEPANLHLSQWGLLANGDISFTKRFRKGHVLFGKRRAYQRKVAVAEFDGICSSDILTFEPKDDALIPELLPFIVQSDGFFEHALGTSSGSLSPRTRWSQLQDYEFPLPPKDEQRRIADILWAADEVLVNYQSAVDYLRCCKAVLLESLLTTGLTGSVVPPHWELLPLSEFVTLKMGFAFKSGDFCASGVQLVRMGNLFERQLDLSRFPVFLPNTFVNEYSSFVLNPGDIIISLTGTTGKKDYGYGVLVPDGSPTLLLNQRVAKVIPKSNVSARYLLQLLWSEVFLQQLYRLSAGTKQANLSSKQLLSIRVPLPPLEEQNILASLLYGFDAQIARVLNAKTNADELKKQLAGDLLMQGQQHVQ